MHTNVTQKTQQGVTTSSSNTYPYLVSPNIIVRLCILVKYFASHSQRFVAHVFTKVNLI